MCIPMLASLLNAGNSARQGGHISPISQMRKTKVREVKKLTVATQLASGDAFCFSPEEGGVVAWSPHLPW